MVLLTLCNEEVSFLVSNFPLFSSFLFPGFISPFGYECINTDGAAYGSVTGCKTYAIKREIADEYLVRRAAEVGSSLYEGFEITEAKLDENTGIWTITTVKHSEHSSKGEKGDEKEPSETGSSTSGKKTTQTWRCRMLLIADGSTSYLGQKLGIISAGSQPEAICSTCYIKDNNWKTADGVMIYNKSTLPGYSALFRHYNNDMYVGTYILPGGKATSRSIAPFEGELMTKHPYVVDALGDKYSYNKKRTVAPLRLGGVPCSYDKQVLLVGDAAGHVDPLTGEGIHTAMIAGKIAGNCLKEMFLYSNFSINAMKAYELRVYDSFLYEFPYSSMAAKIIFAFPLSIDAMACVGKRRGQAFLDFFGEVMTGVKPKSHFLQFDLLLDLTYETIKQMIIQYVLRREPLIPMDIGEDLINEQSTKTKYGNYA
jgi:flavin-dependent dehydrogenase